jgi:hypothetical protein
MWYGISQGGRKGGKSKSAKGIDEKLYVNSQGREGSIFSETEIVLMSQTIFSPLLWRLKLGEMSLKDMFI